jgi:hypothetical protein
MEKKIFFAGKDEEVLVEMKIVKGYLGGVWGCFMETERFLF